MLPAKNRNGIMWVMNVGNLVLKFYNQINYHICTLVQLHMECDCGCCHGDVLVNDNNSNNPYGDLIKISTETETIRVVIYTDITMTTTTMTLNYTTTTSTSTTNIISPSKCTWVTHVDVLCALAHEVSNAHVTPARWPRRLEIYYTYKFTLHVFPGSQNLTCQIKC